MVLIAHNEDHGDTTSDDVGTPLARQTLLANEASDSKLKEKFLRESLPRGGVSDQKKAAARNYLI